ncbi:MAG: chemotaxis protein MotB [Gammaproteobacteria bacterium]|nr:MAG: chemotaxis protein MotB [Gammaproteobacteria bacterium]TND06749.1 MAG: chemotaxis protein MotB [Gammaproteobacteria bacterium]
MARKKKHEEHENLERWLVSYADFITLLFAFFVVMYSVSSVNQGKYRVLSDALVASFRSPLKSLDPIQIGDTAKSIYNPQYAFMKEPSVFNIPKLPQRHVPGAETKGPRSQGDGGTRERAEGRGIEGRAVEQGTTEGQHRGVVSAEGDVENAFQQRLPPIPETGLPPEALQPGTIVSKGTRIGGFGGIEAELPAPLPDTDKTAKELKVGTLVSGGTEIGGFGGVDVELPAPLREVKAHRDVRAISQEFTEKLEGLIAGDLVAIRSDEKALTVEVEIKDNVLFKSGSANVEATALPVLNDLAGVLKQFPYPVRVEGFTDNNPISTSAFPSNWELSAVRAASVVKALSTAGIEPPRLSAVGYGEYRPVAANNTVEGRQQNRRVILVIEANPSAQPILQASLPTRPRSVTFDKEAVALPPPAVPVTRAIPAPVTPVPDKPVAPASPVEAKPVVPVPLPATPVEQPVTVDEKNVVVPAAIKPEPAVPAKQIAQPAIVTPEITPEPVVAPEPLPPPKTAESAGAILQPFRAIDMPNPITMPIAPPIKLPVAPERKQSSELTPNALGVKSIWPGGSKEKP